jgi:murein L,D-transpeptidase YafK
MVHLSGNITLIRACFVRASDWCASSLHAFMTLAVLAGALVLAGCYGDDGYQLPTRAMKELSPEMLTLLNQKNMPKDSPVLVRVFKEESELEVWKQDTTGQFQLLKVYPICRWSGELGPKKTEGDRQAPEGFYSITPGLMNPNSNYYLAINIGFPNAYDKANNYSGAFLMIHGDCSSRGCYAMTDEQIGEIYSLAREAFLGGQKEFQIQAYPFRMTAANLARHRNNPNMPFWRMLKEGSDHFEVSHLEPKVDVCERHYVFDAQPPAGSTKPLIFTPTGRCPNYEVPQEIAGPAGDKQRNDDYQLAQLINRNVPTAPVVMGTDGGMNRVFVAKLDVSGPVYDSEGRIHAPPVHPGMPQPTLSGPHDNTDGTTGSVFGGLFNAKTNGDTAQGAPVASGPQVADSGTQGQGNQNFFGSLFKPKSEPVAPPAEPQGTVLAGLTPAADHRKADAPKLEAQKLVPPKPDTQVVQGQVVQGQAVQRQVVQGQAVQTAAKAKARSQQDANAGAAPAATSNVMKGAQPVVPTGSFDGRWAGLQ